MATPSVLAFDAEGRAIDFEVWLDDLQLFLQCNRVDGLSLLDLTSGAVPAPAADADATVRSLWATRDADARLAVRRHLPTAERAHFSQYKSAQTLYDAVVARYSSPATTALSRLMLPFLFPDLAAFPTVADLIHAPSALVTLATRAALPADFCAKNPPPFESLEKALLAAEKSIVAVGASRGDPRAPIFEGCSPSLSCPLSPLPQRPTSLVLSRSGGVCPLAGDAALARARGARERVGPVGAVAVEVEAAEGVGVAVEVVAGVGVLVAAVEAGGGSGSGGGSGGWRRWRQWRRRRGRWRRRRGVAEVEVVGVELRSGAALGAVSASSSVLATSPPLSSSVSGTRSVSAVGVLVPAPTFSALATALERQCGGAHPAQRCFGRLTTLGASKFPGGPRRSPRWGELSRAGVAIFDVDFDAILAAMYAVTISDEGDCYRCFPPDPGIGTAALGTVLPCPAAPSGTLSGPLPPLVLYKLGQVFAAASRSGPESAPCSCRRLSHETLLWHHRLGHPSLLRLRGMASRLLVSGLPRSLPPLPQGPGPTCVPCVEGRQRAAPHSSQFPPTEAPLQTLHMDVWGPARVRGLGHERYFLLVVDDYSRYTTVFPLRSKGDVTEVLIDWIRAARLQLRQSFGSDFPVLRLHSDRGGEFSSGLLRAFGRARGIRQTFTLPDSPQQNGIAESRIGMVMDVARTSMMHAAAPHFLWPFAVRYAAHQLNLHPRVSRPETSPALLWTGKVGDASAFRVWGYRAFVRDLSADKLSPRAAPCVFLGFPPDAPGWQCYHPTSRRVLSSQDVTFDESVPYYRLFPYRTPSLPPPPHFLSSSPSNKLWIRTTRLYGLIRRQS
ncbi:unnamed protein product [Closterium sp. NIES-64]|nr:unnamed protein product [Closterium sp. NIES-64]